MKKKKKSQARSLLLAVVVLILLCAVYFILDWKQKKDEEAAETEESTEEVLPVSVTEEELSKVTILYEETIMTFEKAEDTWTYLEDEDFPLKSTLVDSKLANLTDISVSRKLEEPAELSEYGLDDPMLEITVEKTDATSFKLYVGDENINTGDYYLKVDDGAEIYTIDSSMPSALSLDIYDLAEGEELPSIDSATIQSVEVEKDGETNKFVSDDATGLVWTLTAADGTENPVESTARDTLLSEAAGLSFDRMVDYRGENLEQYGLEEPFATITVEAKETEVVLQVGDTNEDGNYYVKQKDSNKVHVMAASKLETLLTIEKLDYVDLYVNDIPFTDMESLKVTWQGETRELTTTSETVTVETEAETEAESETEETTEEATEETEPETEIIYHYLVDGKEVDETAFKSFYNSSILLKAQKRMEEADVPEMTEEPELILEYNRLDGTTLTTEYYLGDDGLYTVLCSEGLPAKVSKLDVQEILGDYEEMLAAKETEAETEEMSETETTAE